MNGKIFKVRVALYGVIATMMLSILANATLLILNRPAHDKLWDMAQLCLVGILGLLKSSDEGPQQVQVINPQSDPVPVDATEG